MKRVCLGLPSLDETNDKWPIDHDVAQAVYTIESYADHVWTNTWIHPPHTDEGFHLLARVEYLLELISNEETKFIIDYI